MNEQIIEAMKKTVSDATDRNIVVFDYHAEQGVFTPRLVALTQDVVRNTYDDRLIYVHISNNAYGNTKSWDTGGLFKTIINHYTGRFTCDEEGGVRLVYGVGLSPDKNFGVTQLYQRYFLEELKGCTESDDIEIALGITEKGIPIILSF